MPRGNNIPIALNKVEIYINGSNDLAGIGEVELPNIENATVTSEQMGLASEFETPLLGHFKKLDAKIKMDCVDGSLLSFNNNESIQVECKGTIQSISRETHAAKFQPLDVTLKGLIKKFDGLKLKNGTKLESNFELSVSYYELKINDKEIVKIDVLNNISNINGETNNEIRKHLGII